MNLLLITADDLDATVQGWMGNPLKPTPRLDAFAATCHRLVNNRAAAPICQPSRQAMMTGLLPHRSGGYGFNPVRAGTPSMVTILKHKGYFTAALNKLKHMKPASVFPWDLTADDSGRNPRELARQFAEFLQAAKASGKPFFMNCNLTDPHRPFYGTGPDPIGMLAREIAPAEVPIPDTLEDLPDVRTELAQYYNSVQRMDVSFGLAIGALRAAGEFERTAIVFVSDHGMPLPFGKATVYNNGPWCPLLIRWPGMDAPQAQQAFTSGVDLLPTLLDLLGVAAPDDIDGRSWLPLLEGRPQAGRDHVVTHVHTLYSARYYPQRAVQTAKLALCFSPWADGRTKFQAESMQGLTFNALAAAEDPKISRRVDQYVLGTPLALYDLTADPGQRVNLIADSRFAEEKARLQDLLQDHMVRTNDPEAENFRRVTAGKAPDVAASEAIVRREQAETLGGPSA
jgi:N-sulfoglucosamine sulfohydrolase